MSSMDDSEEDLDHLYIPYEKIESATDKFADENLLSVGSSFKVYKGELFLHSGHLISIVARKSLQTSIVINELSLLAPIKHPNIVSPYRYSVSRYNTDAIITYKYEENGSLNTHLSDTNLTWMQRLHICVRVANALKLLHNDIEEPGNLIIHANIKSSKILLDHKWEPKLNGFGYAVLAKKNQVYLSKYNGSVQYMDPAYVNTRGLTHKSDVFSFGVLLFEVLLGREAYIQNNDNWYFAQLVRTHYKDEKLDDLIDSNLREQMDMQSLNTFAKIAYYCLKEKRSERPDIKQVLLKLEEALEFQRKHEHPTLAVAVEGASSSNYFKDKNLHHLRFRLHDIELATNTFSENCCIGYGGFGKVYKAELIRPEGISALTFEGRNKDEMPKKQSYLAIKRIFNREDKQGEQGFIAEIEILSKCTHPNIVSFQGFCDEGADMILVYEYVSNGSLANYLENNDNMINLTWAQRIQICLDIAHGLNYLHGCTDHKPSIVHRDIKSDNILLDEEWVAKITDFGLSKLGQNQQRSTLITKNIAGTKVYLDPEYARTGKLKTKSDVYSFGVVMLEIMCGKLAFDATYGHNGLPPIARKCYNDGKLESLVDPKLMEADENISMLIEGVNKDSLDVFSKVAYQCVAETQAERPTMEDVIKELAKALKFQKNSKDKLRISLRDIKRGTQNFSDDNCIKEAGFWKLYEGEIRSVNGNTAIFAKRWDNASPQGYDEFLKELEVLVKYNHKNIISLVGYCNEENEYIIVYEHASKGSLDKYLGDPSLTWMKRLKICIDIAKGLEFIHDGGEQVATMIHGDVKSCSILLDDDWNAKVSNFEMSRKTNVIDIQRAEDELYCHESLLGYVDPEYETYGFLTVESDIYSLGVILVEMLRGRLAWSGECNDHLLSLGWSRVCNDHLDSLGPWTVFHYQAYGNLNEVIFEGIKERISPKSLTTFWTIARQCLRTTRNARPMAANVVVELKKALKLQEDYEIWKPKLPRDYKKIIRMSKFSKINKSVVSEKDLYEMFSKGILLGDGKVFFSLGNNGERNEMISSTKFSYKKRTSRKLLSIPESRFHKVAEMLDISKLKIRIRLTTQLLSPGVNYGAYIIFKFCDSRSFSSKPMYVNLKYKKGREKLQAYFATWLDDKWMMIELCRLVSDKKDIDFEVLLDSFSRYHCGNSSIYIEGIEFRVIDNVNREEIEQVQQIPKSNSNKDQLLLSNEVNGKKHVILSAKEVLYDSANVKYFHLQPSRDSRLQEVIELLPQHEFRINCKVQSQMLSQNTKYLCYLVFKLSEKCVGLHCPVIVRDLVRRNKNEPEIIYFRTPDPWNIHENNSVPKQREDGWMEVKVWKFNSNQLKNDCVMLNLKLITYEGTMSGLIVCGLELRPI